MTAPTTLTATVRTWKFWTMARRAGHSHRTRLVTASVGGMVLLNDIPGNGEIFGFGNGLRRGAILPSP